MPARLFASAALILLLAAARMASAAPSPRRFAIVVGANLGDATRAPLRFAESDADKMARVLEELAGVAERDLILLKGSSLGTLRLAFEATARRVREHTEHGGSALVLFYFSGHSDGEALELEHERLSFVELRKWLHETSATVRLAIVDSCQSGALLAQKGGRKGASFDVRLADELSSRGEAVLTSAAASEAALESREIAGSFFTHHLVSGLRGAADLSGDGRVTLGEAYQYAFARTVMATASTSLGSQHPGYEYQLSGRGELFLTDLRHPGSALEVPAGWDRTLIVDSRREQVIAELPATRRPTRVPVPAGEYTVYLSRPRATMMAKVALGNEIRVLGEEDLHPTAVPFAARKGAEPQALAMGPAAETTVQITAPALAAREPVPATRLLWGVGGGGTPAEVNGLSVSLRAARRPTADGLHLSATLFYGRPREEVGSSPDTDHATFVIAPAVGYGLTTTWHNITLYSAATIGAYLMLSTNRNDGGTYASPLVGAYVPVRGVQVGIEGEWPFTLMAYHPSPFSPQRPALWAFVSF
jgi:hypothetical protein